MMVSVYIPFIRTIHIFPICVPIEGSDDCGPSGEVSSSSTTYGDDDDDNDDTWFLRFKCAGVMQLMSCPSIENRGGSYVDNAGELMRRSCKGGLLYHSSTADTHTHGPL